MGVVVLTNAIAHDIAVYTLIWTGQKSWKYEALATS
jgi:hypothetical protein